MVAPARMELFIAQSCVGAGRRGQCYADTANDLRRRDIKPRARVGHETAGSNPPALPSVLFGVPHSTRRRDVQTATATSLLLPPPLAADLGKHSRAEVTTGESGSRVTRFERSGSTVFLKSHAFGTAPGGRPLFDEA